MSIIELVKKYNTFEKKDIAIKSLAKEYNIPEKQVIEILNFYNIEAPKIVNRAELVDLDTHVNKAPIDIELKKDFIQTVSINRLLSEIGLDKIKGIDDIKKAFSLLMTEYGIKPIDFIKKALESFFEYKGAKSIGEIMNSGKINIGIESHIHDTMLRMAKKTIDDIADEWKEPIPEPTPENELRKKIMKGLMVLKNVLG